MNKSKPRWEIKYEEYLSEEPIADKIAKLEENKKMALDNLEKEIEELKSEKVTGDFKTREEYEKAVENHTKLIEDKENELNGKKDGKDEKLEGYKNFEKNKDKIKNIYEYRQGLEAKLEKIENSRKELADKKIEFEKNEEILKEQEGRLDKLLEEINGNPKAADIEEKNEDLDITVNVIKNLKNKSNTLQTELKGLEEINGKLEPNADMYERRIAKCNMIAAGLMKGKELGDIELKVDEGRYTDQTGELGSKIQNYKEIDEVDKAKDDVVLKFVDAKEDVKDVDDKEIKEDEEEIANKEGKEDEDNKNLVAVGRISLFTRIKNFFKKIGNKISTKVKEAFAEDEIDDAIEKDSDDVSEGFASHFKDDVEEIKESTGKEISGESKGGMENHFSDEEKDSTDMNVSDKSKDDIENEILKGITNYGEKTFREKLQEYSQKEARKRYEESKLNAANEYAEKYGGRYEHQDGATATKENDDNERE